MACSYFLLKTFFGCRIASYTHYPMISSDMMGQIGQGAQFNNSEAIERSLLYRNVKRVYYWLLMGTYRFCGRFADQVATNSSWTNAHILELWNQPARTVKIYPPCDTLCPAIELSDMPRRNIMMSFAQFRPEKDHPLQLHVWQTVVKSGRLPRDAQFWLCGSTRGPDDERIVAELRQLAKELGVESSVQFKLNLPRSELNEIFRVAKVGIHTMKQEHFGISIVEMMAAGLVTIAHASAGPLLDIIGGSKDAVVGYLAKDEADYSRYVLRAFADESGSNDRLVRDAKIWVTEQFGIATFER